MASPSHPDVQRLRERLAILEASVSRLSELVADGDRERRQQFFALLAPSDRPLHDLKNPTAQRLDLETGWKDFPE
jgi:hypothetical protein